MRRAGLTVACLLLLSPSLAHAQGGAARDRVAPPIVRGTASISGIVVASDSGRPLRFARVTASAPELADGGRVTTTDENGRFELPQLPAGHYTLSASKTGFIGVNFGERRPLGSGRPVEVRDGQRVDGIDFRLPRNSVITGRVLDQDGEPLVRASVRALRYRMVQGEGRVENSAGTETDDRGQYRIYGLQPGAYFVSAIANMAELGAGRSGFVATSPLAAGGGMTVSVTESWQGDGNAQGNVTYAPTYYPGVAALADAGAVNVGVADEVAGVDFSLRLLVAARVSGLVVGPSGVAANATVMIVPEDPRGVVSGLGNYSTQSNRDGSFAISNVPPGRYLALARARPGGRGGSGGDADMFAVAPLTVNGGAVPGVTLTLGPGMTISGQVTFEGASVPSAMEISRIRIGLAAPSSTQLPLVGGTLMNTSPRADGTFAIASVPPGTRTFRVASVPAPWTLKAIYLDGRDVTDGPFEIKAGDAGGRVTIVMTDRASTLGGTVRDMRGQPFVDCTVVAFAADEQMWRPQSRFIQAVRPGTDGVYQMSGLPPGEYLVVAAEDLEQGDWFDSSILAALRSQAVHVPLSEGVQKTADLRPVTLTR